MIRAYRLAAPKLGAALEVLSPKAVAVALGGVRDDLHQAREAARGSPYLSSKEAARYLGFNHRSLQNLRRRGGGPRFVRFGRQVRYHIRDLVAYGVSPAGHGSDRG